MTNNILSGIGDKLFLNSQLGFFGKIQIDNFNLITEGETLDRILQKKFKYSIDNLNWSDWMILSLDNLQLLNDKNVDILFLNFWLERFGSDETGIIEIGDLTIDGSIIVKVDDYSTTEQSLFEELINNDALTVSVANNLLKKIFEKGIIPNYIDRGYGVDNKDFISFWSAICAYFSYVIGLANKFDNIFNDKDFLSEYLIQRGIEFSKDEITLEDLQYISNNMFDEFRKRGTKSSFVDRSFLFMDNSSPQIDGEWLRLISKNHYDEFLIEFVKNEHCGYYIDKSSHMYNGTNLSSQLNKTKENTADFLDLTNFKFENELTSAYSIENVLGKNCLKIVPDTYPEQIFPQTFGLGFGDGNFPLEVEDKFLTNVDSGIDYEITLSIKKENVNNFGNLKVGVLAFNVNNYLETNSFKDYKTNIPKIFFCSKPINSICKTDEFYFLRFIIYAKDSIPQITQIENNDFGITKLKFGQEINKIIPIIQIESNDPNDSVFIHDYKIRPLIRGRNILNLKVPTSADFEIKDSFYKNPCFVQNNSSVISWFKNNSDKRDIYVFNFINNYLLPYHKNLFQIDLKPKTNDKQLLT